MWQTVLQLSSATSNRSSSNCLADSCEAAENTELLDSWPNHRCSMVIVYCLHYKLYHTVIFLSNQDLHLTLRLSFHLVYHHVCSFKMFLDDIIVESWQSRLHWSSMLVRHWWSYTSKKKKRASTLNPDKAGSSLVEDELQKQIEYHKAMNVHLNIHMCRTTRFEMCQAKLRKKQDAVSEPTANCPQEGQLRCQFCTPISACATSDPLPPSEI